MQCHAAPTGTSRVARNVSSRAARPRSTSTVQEPERRAADTESLTLSTRKPRDSSLAAQDASNSSHDPSAVEPRTPDASTPEPNSFPPRYKLVLACMSAFVICNMDKVNMSVAILPMSQQFGWSASVAGLVQSSFFWGYMLSQVPAGYLANKYSGRRLLPGGVGIWSGFTAAVPLLTSTVPTLCLSRAAVGFGEGVAPSAVNDIVVKAVPLNERARSISTIFGGLHIGSILGLLLAPPIISNFGWEAVFYVFGALGLVWVAGFQALVGTDSPEWAAMRSSLRSDEAATGVATTVPFRAFLRNGPTRALMFTHFCNNWFHYTMLAWLPTYFTQTLQLGIAEASTVSLFPSIAGVAVSSVAGQVADRLIEGGMPVRRVRQLAQSTAFLAPAVCLVGAGALQGTYGSIACISAALGLNSFALAGLYCTHQDMSKRFAGPLLGLTNTSGAVPGIVGVAFVGVLLDATDSWQLALFAPIVLCFLAGTLVFVRHASSEEQDYSNNEPFEFEGRLRDLWARVKAD